MKLTKTLFLGAAVFSLGACSTVNYGTEISFQEFAEEVTKLEEKQYTNAVFSYSYKATSKSSLLGGKAITTKDSGKFTYTMKEGTFVKDEGQKEPLVDSIGYLEMFIGLNAKESAESESGGTISDGTMTFYKAPFGTKAEQVISDESDPTFKVVDTVTKYVQFNEYGYMVKMNIDETIESTTIMSDSSTYKSTTKIKATINISYK